MAGPIDDEDVVASRGEQTGPALAPVRGREITNPGVAAAMDHHDRPSGGRMSRRSDALDVDRSLQSSGKEAARGSGGSRIRPARAILHGRSPSARLQGHVRSLAEMLTLPQSWLQPKSLI